MHATVARDSAETVYSILDAKDIQVERLTYDCLIAAKDGLIDSDQAMLEDRQGYRYKRSIKEEVLWGVSYFIFRQI